MNALMLDAEPHPPDVELREAMDATRGEGDAVVRAHRARQAELPEGPLEDRAGAPALDVWQSLAGEEIAGMLIPDREGVAPHAVAGRELAFEIGGPEIVRGLRRRGRVCPVVASKAPGRFR